MYHCSAIYNSHKVETGQSSCMDGWISEWVDGWISGWMDGWINE